MYNETKNNRCEEPLQQLGFEEMNPSLHGFLTLLADLIATDLFREKPSSFHKSDATGCAGPIPPSGLAWPSSSQNIRGTLGPFSNFPTNCQMNSQIIPTHQTEGERSGKED